MWLDSLIKKFQQLAKRQDGLKEVVNYMKNNKKSFKSFDFYQDFIQKLTQLETRLKQKTRKPKEEPRIMSGSYLDEEDIYNARYAEESRGSIVSVEQSFEELKVINWRDSIVENNMREYQVQKGKVKSTYVMKNDLTCSPNTTVISGDLETINTLDPQVGMIYRIIRHQLRNKAHPIRMIIKSFSLMFVRAYQSYVNKGTNSVDDLYDKLESTNRQIYEQAKNGAELRRMHLQKRQSERIGEIHQADRTNLPTYFLFGQVVSDVQQFIKEMVYAVNEFYSIVTKKSTLDEIEEELIEWLTDYILKGNLQKVVFAFFKLEAESKKKLLIEKYKEFINIKPEHVGIDEKFALNMSSPIIQIYEYMLQAKMRINASIYSPPGSGDKDSDLGSDEELNNSQPVYNIRINDDERGETRFNRLRSNSFNKDKETYVKQRKKNKTMHVVSSWCC